MNKLFVKSKKGQAFDQLGQMGVGIASLIIIFAVVFLILSQTRSQQATLDGCTLSNVSTYSTGCNASVTLTNAAATVPDWVPLVVIAVIGAILIGLVSMFRGRGQ